MENLLNFIIYFHKANYLMPVIFLTFQGNRELNLELSTFAVGRLNNEWLRLLMFPLLFKVLTV